MKKRCVVISPELKRTEDVQLRSMIDELATSMYVPVVVVDEPDVSVSHVGCQAGFSCLDCDLCFPTDEERHSHLRSHHHPMYPAYDFMCDRCGAPYRRVSALRRHLKVVHNLNTIKNVMK